MCLHDNVDLLCICPICMSVLEQNSLYHREKKACRHILVAKMYDDDEEEEDNDNYNCCV